MISLTYQHFVRKTAGGWVALCERERDCILTLQHKELLCGLLTVTLVFRLTERQGGAAESTVIITKLSRNKCLFILG